MNYVTVAISLVDKMVWLDWTRSIKFCELSRLEARLWLNRVWLIQWANSKVLVLLVFKGIKGSLDVVSPYCQLGIQLWILVEAARLLPFYICFGNPLSIHRVGGLLFFHSFYSRLERFLNEVRKIRREASKRGKWTLDVLLSSSLEAVHNISILYSSAHTLWVTSPPTMDIGSTCALSSWFTPLRA